MNKDIISDPNSNQKTSNMLHFMFNSKKKSNKFKRVLPQLSITENLNNSIPRSRIFSLNHEPTGFITSRIDLIQFTGDYCYKALNQQTLSLKNQRDRIPDTIEKSIEGCPSVHSYQTTKFKCPSMLESIRQRRNYNLQKYLDDNLTVFCDIIKKKDMEKLISFLNYPFQYSQEQNLLETFCELLYFIAYYGNTILQLNKSTFLFKDCLKLSELCRNHQLKVKILIQLFSIAKQLKQYDKAHKFILKALSYAWADNMDDYEIDCYDKLGICYFYMGDINKANHLHNKWVKCEIEPRDSYYRITSKEFILLYEKFQPFCKEFDDKISRYIHIPFINIKTGQSFDSNSTLKYNTCEAIPLINEILYGYEYTEYFLDYHYIEQAQKKHLKKSQLPRRALEIMQKYDKNKDKYIFDHKIHENPIYKLSLQEKVNYRKTKFYSLDSVQQNIQKYISEQREPFKKSEKIYVKESQRKDLSPQNGNQLYQHFRKILVSIINQN
ncbi:unnamed protein product [Paramecium primaurelia]|uniref:Uncharacterized protein n=1 Tax=Paramecium primaurelia TaxID=5886 RepID=A0A8S1Q8W5_PARPR|nr:unnamed protein product [Paramecium primaurelia]